MLFQQWHVLRTQEAAGLSFSEYLIPSMFLALCFRGKLVFFFSKRSWSNEWDLVQPSICCSWYLLHRPSCNIYGGGREISITPPVANVFKMALLWTRFECFFSGYSIRSLCSENAHVNSVNFKCKMRRTAHENYLFCLDVNVSTV